MNARTQFFYSDIQITSGELIDKCSWSRCTLCIYGPLWDDPFPCPAALWLELCAWFRPDCDRMWAGRLLMISCIVGCPSAVGAPLQQETTTNTNAKAIMNFILTIILFSFFVTKSRRCFTAWCYQLMISIRSATAFIPFIVWRYTIQNATLPPVVWIICQLWDYRCACTMTHERTCTCTWKKGRISV